MNRIYTTPTILVVMTSVESGFLSTVNAGIEDAPVIDQGEY